jgi:hypothetical protein
LKGDNHVTFQINLKNGGFFMDMSKVIVVVGTKTYTCYVDTDGRKKRSRKRGIIFTDAYHPTLDEIMQFEGGIPTDEARQKFEQAYRQSYVVEIVDSETQVLIPLNSPITKKIVEAVQKARQKIFNRKKKRANKKGKDNETNPLVH